MYEQEETEGTETIQLRFLCCLLLVTDIREHANKWIGISIRFDRKFNDRNMAIHVSVIHLSVLPP